MDETVLLILLLYGIPVLCAVVAIVRAFRNKAQLEQLRARVALLEAKFGQEATSETTSEATAETTSEATAEETSEETAEKTPEATAEQNEAAPEPVFNPKPPSVLTTLWGWFRANPILYIGLGVFLTGMAFALNFLTFHGYLTVELRLGAATLAGAAFLGGGWKLRSRNALVSQALMGGGAVVLYLTLFMAARLPVLGMGSVFGGMVALVVGTTLLAVKVDAQVLAVLATAGGFAVPVLLATETGNHVGLFSYYALLAAGNLLLLRFRAWDIPALVSFAAVSLVGGVWGRDAYRPDMFPAVEGFLILFFLIFSVIQLQLLRHAQEKPLWSKRFVHASYLFGLPLLAFGCQYLLTRPYLYADAVSALALAAWHLALHLAYRTKTDTVSGLARDAFLVIGVGFFALSVPLALHAPWITCTWALQGAGLVWLGLRQERRSLQWAGYGLQVLGLLDLLHNFTQLQTPVWGGLTNGFVIGVLALCLSGLTILRELHSRPRMTAETRTTGETRTAGEIPRDQLLAYRAAQIWAVLVWLLVLYFQLDAMTLTAPQRLNGLALGAAVSGFIWFAAGQRLGLRLWLYPVQGVWLLLFVYLPNGESWSQLAHPFEGGGLPSALHWGDMSAVGVPLTIAMAHYALQRAPELWSDKWRNTSLAGLWLFALFFVVFQWGSCLYPGLTENAYAAFFWMLLPVAALPVVMPHLLRRLLRLPLYAQSGAAMYRALNAVLSVWLVLAFLNLCTYDGRTLAAYYDGRTLAAYVPLFSWVDVTQLLVLLLCCGRAIPGMARFWIGQPTKGEYICLGLGVFMLSTVMAARTVSAVTGVAYAVDALLHDPAFRFVLSVLWGGMALGLMLAAARILKGDARRPLWFTGAALLLLTVLKLLLLDMADRSTVYRMVSFLSLGLLMLGMGYFCPLPPKKPIEEQSTQP